MGYRVTIGEIKSDLHGMYWGQNYCIYDSQGDSIEGAEDKPWAKDQSLQLTKNQIGSYECTVPYMLWHVKYGLKKDDFVERQVCCMVEQDDDILFMGYLTNKNLTFDRGLYLCFTECLGVYDENDMLLEPQEYVLTCETDGSHWDDFEQGEGTPSLWFKIFHDANANGELAGMGAEAPTVQRGVKKDLSDEGQQVGTAWSFWQKYFLDEYDGYMYVKYVRKDNGYFDITLCYELDITTTTKQTVEYGKNLLDLEVEEKLPSDFCNYVIAWGTNTTTKGWWIFKKTKTSKVLGSALNYESSNKYGSICRYLLVDGNSTKESLDKLAQEELDTHEQWAEVSITLTAFDRVDSGELTDRLGYMKKTKVLSGPHEVDGWYVCTKIDLDPASPASTQFTFGNPPKKLTDQQNKVKTQLASTAVMVGGMMGYLNM